MSSNSNVTNQPSFVATDVGHMATRAAFLSIFILFGFLGNCLLVATISQSKRLRISKLNLHIISMASINLVDTALNQPLILGSTITQTWDYGEFICQFNSFFVQMVNFAMLVGLCMMTLDRLFAVINPEQYKVRMNHRNTVIVVVYVWLQAIIFSIPVLAGTIPSKPFSARYLCSIASNAPLLYIATSTCFSVLLPILFTVIFFMIIIRSYVRQKVHDRETILQNHYTSNTNDELQIWTELYGARYVALLCIMWVLLVGPYVTLNYIEQYRNSAEVQDLPTFMMFRYPWELDLVFMWMKLSYVVILPIFTYIFRKEVWQKIKDLMLCRKSNTIIDASPDDSPSRRDVEKAKGLREVQQTTFSVPIIFATTDGLHVHSSNEKHEDRLPSTDDFMSEISEKSMNTLIMQSRKCDVYGSLDYLHGDEDTSDYDSQCDPFSASNPISVRDLPQPDGSNEVQMVNGNSLLICHKESPDEGVENPEIISEVVKQNNITGGRKSWQDIRHEKTDSGIDSAQNTHESDLKKSRRKRTNSGPVSMPDPPLDTKVERFEEGGNEGMEPTLEPSDSGRGTAEFKKTSKKKREHSLALAHPDPCESERGSVPSQSVPKMEPDMPEEPSKSVVENCDQISNHKVLKTKRSKSKKKRKRKGENVIEKQSAVVAVQSEETEGCDACHKNQCLDGSPSMLKRPLRLKPLEFSAPRIDFKMSKSQNPDSVQKYPGSVEASCPKNNGNDILFEQKLIPRILPNSETASPKRQSEDYPLSVPEPGGLVSPSTDVTGTVETWHKSEGTGLRSLTGAQIGEEDIAQSKPKFYEEKRSPVPEHNSWGRQKTVLCPNASFQPQEQMVAMGHVEAVPKKKKKKKRARTKTESSQDLLTEVGDGKT